MPKKRALSPETGDLFAPRERPPAPPALTPPAEPADEELFLAPRTHGERKEKSLYFDGPFREFEHNGGVHLSDSVLWCDADRRHDLSFISHAHADYIGRNRRILATDKTVRILTRGTGKIEALTSPYRRSFTLGPLQLEMYPAGHILGSAQLLITRDSRRIVYTSNVNTRQCGTVERGEPIACDVLAIPATYGLPHYRFPPREEVIEGIRRFIERTLEERATPVLIAHQIGTSQELMHVLGTAGHRLRVHRSIHEVGKRYRELGVSLPNARIFQGPPARDEVVLFPPILRKHASIRKLKKSRTALVTGRALDEDFVFRARADAAFPLSDSADHEDLLAFIQKSGASEVYLIDGHVDAFAQVLSARGIRTYSLVSPEQLTLF